MYHVDPNSYPSHDSVSLDIFEDNESLIKMIITDRSPTMSLVSRTHRVALDWMFDRINLDTYIQDKYVDTKSQPADILTEGTFTRDEWTLRLQLIKLINIPFFLSSHCSTDVEKTKWTRRAVRCSRSCKIATVAKPDSLVLLSSSSKWSANTLSDTAGKIEEHYQNFENNSTGSSDAKSWNYDDVLISPERSLKGEVSIP